MKTIAQNQQFVSFEADPKQKTTSDPTFVNCSEMSAEALLAFLDSKKIRDFEFFAVLSGGLTAPIRNVIRAVREWATTKKDDMATGNLPLCEMLLWDRWWQNFDDWVLSLGADVTVAMPADHPILKPENKTQAAFTQGTMLFYAVDMKARAVAEEAARKNPFSLPVSNKKPHQAQQQQQRLLTASTSNASTSATAQLTIQNSSTATATTKTEPLKELTIFPQKVMNPDEKPTDPFARVLNKREHDDDDDVDEDRSDVSEKRRKAASPEVE